MLVVVVAVAIVISTKESRRGVGPSDPATVDGVDGVDGVDDIDDGDG